MEYHIIADIHGQAEKLEGLLRHLGWRRDPAGWTGGAPEIVFLGDFIDRGSENARVIATVRSLIDCGKAHAVMGNHELNAIHFHTMHPKSGTPLRAHSAKNMRQHGRFLDEFPIGAAPTTEAIDWMRTLPLYREFAGFRAVHACWDAPSIAMLDALCDAGGLTAAQFVQAADKGHGLFDAVETTAKGPEARLPQGAGFEDKDGTRRNHVRIKWWQGGARSWADIAMSVPDLAQLPETPLPGIVKANVYQAQAKPVFFGHYWLTGTPVLQAANALCLDYSAGKNGPLLAYRFEDGAALDLANLVSVPV